MSEITGQQELAVTSGEQARRGTRLQPTSVAAVLLREFESHEAAIRYAQRKVAYIVGNPTMAAEYAEAVRTLEADRQLHSQGA